MFLGGNHPACAIDGIGEDIHARALRGLSVALSHPSVFLSLMRRGRAVCNHRELIHEVTARRVGIDDDRKEPELGAETETVTVLRVGRHSGQRPKQFCDV
jgi:uncharacterized Zn-finger protein